MDKHRKEKGSCRDEDFNERALCSAYDVRSGRTVFQRIYCIKGYRRETGYFQKIPGTNYSLFKSGKAAFNQQRTSGGYKLAKHPSEITVYDVLECAEGDLAPVSCLQNESEPCERSAECLTLPIWRGLDEVVKNYLKGITLQDALNNRPDAPEYSI